jgi:hypothetical protein
MTPLILAGCVPDAPRENPLDPHSPNFRNSGTVSGKVLTYYEPFLGIPGASVTLPSKGITLTTNSTGSFLFENVEAGDLTLVVSKAGYATDTVRTTLVAGGNATVQSRLNALPLISQAKIVTRKVDQWWPGPVYSAVVTANVTDPDGAADISEVIVTVDTLRLAMSFFTDPPRYQVTISGSSLPGRNIEWLVGKQIQVLARDKPKGSSLSAPFYVLRIVQQTVVPTYPTALDTASASPEFQWARPDITFPYSYKLELYRQDEGVPTLIWNREGLLSTLTRFQYPDTLPPALYFWTIFVIDEYGNLSRSKEASFMVIHQSNQ